MAVANWMMTKYVFFFVTQKCWRRCGTSEPGLFNVRQRGQKCPTVVDHVRALLLGTCTRHRESHQTMELEQHGNEGSFQGQDDSSPHGNGEEQPSPLPAATSKSLESAGEDSLRVKNALRDLRSTLAPASPAGPAGPASELLVNPIGHNLSLGRVASAGINLNKFIYMESIY